MNVGGSNKKFEEIKCAQPKKLVQDGPEFIAERKGSDRSSLTNLSTRPETKKDSSEFSFVNALSELEETGTLSAGYFEAYKDAPRNPQVFESFKKDFVMKILSYAKASQRKNIPYVKELLKSAIARHLDFNVRKVKQNTYALAA